MIAIRSEQGYPQDGQILARVDYFIDSPSEGVILLLGKDGMGEEYKAKKTPEPCYRYPSGRKLDLRYDRSGQASYPALSFGFQLNSSRWQPKIIGDRLEDTEFNDDFYSKFDLKLMGEDMRPISFPNPEIEREFKTLAVWGAYELRGLPRNHFWGEMYLDRSPAWEEFLEEHRAL